MDASLDPLSCTASSATLGAAGTTLIFRDFPNAPVANTWYHSALANALAGQDLETSESDIVATFNSSIDNNNNCLAGLNWYLGYDNNPGGGISLLDVLLHEFAHGLGFSGFVNLNNGQFLNGFQDVFSLNTLDNSSGRHWDNMSAGQRRNSAKNNGNVVWDGARVKAAASGTLSSGQDSAGNVKLYTPNPIEQGSSVYHFDTTVSPNALMEPDLNAGLGSKLDLTDEQMLDVGWNPQDSDGDGLSDYAESQELGTNPTNFDSDGDGLTDGDGVIAVAAYPGGVDADNDGFVDGENETGTDPTDADSDDDGINDGAEWATGTDPNDAAPEVLILTPVSGSSFSIGESITFNGTATDDEDGNLSAAIQWSSDKDGSLATGASLSISLSNNSHLISATATDSAGATTLVSVSVSVTVSGLPGDINDDGLVDVADLLLLHRALTGTISLSTAQQERADIHPAGGSNGLLDVGDLLELETLLTAP